MNILEELTATASGLDLRTPTNGTVCGCCGGYSTLQELPLGVGMRLSVKKLDEFEKQQSPFAPRFSVTQKAIDCGGGNWLNIRLTHCKDKTLPATPEAGYEKTIQIDPCIPEGPPVYGAYFGSIQAGLTHGKYIYMNDPNGNFINKEKYTVEILKDAKKLTNCTVVFVVRSYSPEVLETLGTGYAAYDQRSVLIEKFLKPAGWWDDLVWESPLFENRMHNRGFDNLQCFVIQRKEA